MSAIADNVSNSGHSCAIAEAFSNSAALLLKPSRGDRLSSVSTRRSPLLEKRPRDLRFTFSTRFERATREHRTIGISISAMNPRRRSTVRGSEPVTGVASET